MSRHRDHIAPIGNRTGGKRHKARQRAARQIGDSQTGTGAAGEAVAAIHAVMVGCRAGRMLIVSTGFAGGGRMRAETQCRPTEKGERTQKQK